MKKLCLTAPSRLHFGLLSFGHSDRRQFGGVGVMVEGPRLRLAIQTAKRFEVRGALAKRITEFASRWSQSEERRQLPACAICLEAVPPLHVGLGVGTQLGLAVAAGLNRFVGRRTGTAEQLATSVGRGQRSAVGTFGFLQGGFIAERGKLQGEALSPLWTRIPIPPAWRFILITPRRVRGLHGQREREAFANLPAVPRDITESLTAELQESMIPAAQRANFPAFSESVYRYGRLAGNCFASIQGGPYNGRHLQAVAERLRAIGLRGVGQSSWGPTLFVLSASPEDAEQAVNQIQPWPELAASDILIAKANNTGVQFSSEE